MCGFILFKMKKISNLIVIFLFVSFAVKAQCECYTVKKIWIPDDVKNKIYVSFTNKCDNNVYLRFWLIQDKDTVARYDECLCGVIPIKEPNTVYEFETKLTKLPPLNNLRVAMSNGTLNCPSIKFSPELFVLSTEPQNNSEATIYPNPTDDSVNLENIPYNTNFQLYNLQGVLLQEWVFKEKQKISLKSYPSGMYLIKYQVNSQVITHKIFKR